MLVVDERMLGVLDLKTKNVQKDLHLQAKKRSRARASSVSSFIG